MAKAPLARVGQTENIDIVWHPFELRPEPTPLLDPNSEYIQRSWRDSVLPLSRELGMPMKQPTVIPRTRLAHEAAEFARLHGAANDMVDALYKAYQQEGHDIGEIDVLVETGEAVGLDPDALRKILEERSLEADVDKRLALAKQLQITAVPSLLVGEKYMLRGLVSEEQLAKAIAMVRDQD